MDFEVDLRSGGMSLESYESKMYNAFAKPTQSASCRNCICKCLWHLFNSFGITIEWGLALLAIAARRSSKQQ